jgi:hypothetical protein
LDGATIPLSRALRRWAFAVIPVLGVVELVAHVAETRPGPSDADWDAARDYVAREAHPEDLVDFAPRWVDPLGRMHFGQKIATLEREAPPDVTRFPRAFEVSLHGGHLRSLEGWRKGAAQSFGAITVTTWENPSPAHVLADLVSSVESRSVRVTRGGVECPFQRTSPQSGNLGFGPAVPGARYVCPGGVFVGVSVVADLDYAGHRCIYAPPNSGPPIDIHFLDVPFGTALHGHHALYVEAERDRKGAPVSIAWKAGGNVLGQVDHYDGDGWKPFEFDTSALAGTRGELEAEISSQGSRRMYCFEADTR